jgi:hypothetical protein
VFENRVLKRIVGSKEEDVIERWKRLHNEELHNSYVPPNIITVDGACSTRGRYEKCIQNFRRKT